MTPRSLTQQCQRHRGDFYTCEYIGTICENTSAYEKWVRNLKQMGFKNLVALSLINLLFCTFIYTSYLLSAMCSVVNRKRNYRNGRQRKETTIASPTPHPPMLVDSLLSTGQDPSPSHAGGLFAINRSGPLTHPCWWTLCYQQVRIPYPPMLVDSVLPDFNLDFLFRPF